MDELQQKIKEAERHKVEMETLRLASIEEKLVQKAKIGIQHAEVIYTLRLFNILKTP